jgi:hypothetical protein
MGTLSQEQTCGTGSGSDSPRRTGAQPHGHLPTSQQQQHVGCPAGAVVTEPRPGRAVIWAKTKPAIATQFPKPITLLKSLLMPPTQRPMLSIGFSIERHMKTASECYVPRLCRSRTLPALVTGRCQSTERAQPDNPVPSIAVEGPASPMPPARHRGWLRPCGRIRRRRGTQGNRLRIVKQLDAAAQAQDQGTRLT